MLFFIKVKMADSLTVLLCERLGDVMSYNAVIQFYQLEHAAHFVVN
jgi:hypothetical protein